MFRRLVLAGAALLAPLLLATCKDFLLPHELPPDSLLQVKAPESLTIAIRGSLPIRDSITVKWPNGDPLDNPRLVFAALAESVATVDTSGLIEASARGKGRIRVSVLSSSGGAQGKMPADTISVGAIIAGMELGLSRDTLTAIGDSLPCDLRIRYLDARDDTIPRTSLGARPSCRWLRGDSVVTVDTAKRVIRADSNGVDTVEVALDTASVLREVTVRQRADTVVMASPVGFRFRALGATHQFSAEGVDRNGHAINGRSATWKSSDSRVVSIDSATGVGTSHKNGQVHVTAAMDGATTTDSSVTVSQVASKLVFGGLPDTIVAGAVITPPIQDTLVDSLGSRVVTFNRSVAVEVGTNATCGTLGGTTTHSADSGVVTFDDLRIEKAGPCVLVATADSVSPALSRTFAVIPGTAASVSVIPSSYQFRSLGESHAFVVTAADSLGNAIGNPTPRWQSSDPTVVFVDSVTGVATAQRNSTDTVFVFAKVDSASGSASVQVSQVPIKLWFISPPHDTTAGAILTPAVQVAIQDALGNAVTSFTGQATVHIDSGPSGGKMIGDTIATGDAGVATFSNLAFNKAGTYRLQATAVGLADTSPAFVIAAGQATQLAFTVQPGNTPVGSTISPSVEVTAQDPFANTATSFTGDMTVAIGTNPSGGALYGTTTRAAVAGVATFSDLAIDKGGDGYTLIASGESLAADTSNTFNVKPSYRLNLLGSGSGNGTVTSEPAGVNCALTNGTSSGTCNANFISGTTVALTASPDPGHSFTQWSGCDAVNGSTCTVTMTSARSVTVTFAAPSYSITVTGAGAGSGKVTSSPSGIDCSISGGTTTGTCAASFTSATPVTLTAAPDGISVFDGWSGACTGTGSACTVSITQDTSVTVTFGRTYALTVGAWGNGDGTVTSNPAGISCYMAQGNVSGTCGARFTEGATVKLTEVPASGYDSFTSWSGACGGTSSTCTVSMTQDQNATASFSHVYYTLAVHGSGSGSGTVTYLQINCSISAGTTSGTCSYLFRGGSNVTLTASAASNSAFTGWSGDCSGASRYCTLTMTGTKSVTASFAVLRTLAVTLQGSGSGTVTSDPIGVNCTKTGAYTKVTCYVTFEDGTTVTLSAMPASGHVFTGWESPCGGTGTCQVTMNQDVSRAAAFANYTTATVRLDSIRVVNDGDADTFGANPGEWFWYFNASSTAGILTVSSRDESAPLSATDGAVYTIGASGVRTMLNTDGNWFSVFFHFWESDLPLSPDDVGGWSETYTYNGLINQWQLPSSTVCSAVSSTTWRCSKYLDARTGPTGWIYWTIVRATN